MFYKKEGASFFRFVTIHALDRQTDGRRTKRPWQYRALHYMQSLGENLTVFLKFVTPIYDE